MKKIILLILILRLYCLYSSESDIISIFDNYFTLSYESRCDSLEKFKSDIKRNLSTIESYHCSFDSLSKKITIKQSLDKKIRIFSWDNLTGGTWHSCDVIIQFKISENEFKTLWLDQLIEDIPEGKLDVIIYDLYEIKNREKPIYLLFGSGTRGAGNKHKSIFLFSIENNNLVHEQLLDDKYCFLQVRRGKSLNLKFDIESKIISFNESFEDNNSGFSFLTGKVVKLQFIDGSFKEIGG